MVWEQPKPGKLRPARAWLPLLAEVARRPGQWARVASYAGETSAYKAAHHLRARSDLPVGAWEFAARRGEGRGSVLYARFRPTEATPAEGTGDEQGDREHRPPTGPSPSVVDALAAAHRATRQLLRISSREDATDILVAFVNELGGTTVKAHEEDERALPFDLSLGEDEPLRAAAHPTGLGHGHLEELLGPLVEDARCAVQLVRAARLP